MNTLLLFVLATCPPGGDPGYPQAPASVTAAADAGPAQGGASHQGRPRLFGWLRGQRHGKCACGGNGHADGGGTPAALASAPVVGTGPVVEAMSPEPAPTVIAPAASAEPAPRWVARPQTVMTSAEPPLADPPAPAGAAPRLVPVPAR
jgi:hypothetical protein